jgi:hypothetical protein
MISTEYRPDIDGIRALAVLSVFIFHLHPGLLPGGFLGVDIFFVISGYLIPGIIVHENSLRTFSFTCFYARRIRRIFPALFAVLLILGTIATLLLPHKRIKISWILPYLSVSYTRRVKSYQQHRLNFVGFSPFTCEAILSPNLRGYFDLIKCKGLPSLLIMLCMSRQAVAGEIEPKAYTNTPVGINFLLAGYTYSYGGLSTEASSSIQDAQLKISSEILAFARALDVWGKSGKVDVILPYSQLSGSATVAGETVERNVSGFNDPRLRFSVNFYGAPALSLQEFGNYRQDLIIGGSIQISAPFGQYDRNKMVNLGNNRWFVKPDLGISKAWGNFSFECSSGVILFSRNDDFFGGKTLDQDALLSTQIHATYSFGRGMWAALSSTYDYGGRNEIDGLRGKDAEDNLRMGATFAMPVNRNNSIKLFASSPIQTSSGSDYDLIGIFWQYRWGEDL